MKKILLVICCFIINFWNLKAQEVRVVNALTDEFVPFVYAYNKVKSRSALGDKDGLVDVKIFTDSDVIYFQALGYKTYRTNREELKNKSWILFVEPIAESMEAVILSVNKFEQFSNTVTQKVATVDSKEIIFNNPQTSADLLQQSGQVFVQKSQQGGGSPILRGFSTNRLLITVDGIRMNTAIFRAGNLQNVISIDPLSIDRTEVILGPASVVYGSDALGGVFNFFTLKPKFSDSLSISGKAIARYATANNENTAHTSFNIGTNNFAAATSISLNYFDDLRQGSNGPDKFLRNQYAERENGTDVIRNNDNPLVQRPTGYNQINLLQKLRYAPSDRWNLDGSVIYTATSDFDRYDALNRFRSNGNPRNAEWYYGPQNWLLTSVKATHQGNGRFYDEAVFTQSYQLFKEGRNERDFNSISLFETDEKVNVFTTNLDFNRRDRENNVLYYGVEYLDNKVNSTGKFTDITTNTSIAAASRYPDGSTWRSLAGYVNYQWNPQQNLTVQAGARYNYIWLDAQFDNRLFSLPFTEARVQTGALTGGLGAAYKISDLWKINANLSSAFRAPNIDDIGKIFEPAPGVIIVPNPNLKPEYSYNAEVGASFDNLNNFSFKVNAYYTLLTDALVARAFTLDGQDRLVFDGEDLQIQAIQNLENSKIYGLELGAGYRFDSNLEIVAHYNIVKGKQEEQDGSTVAVRHVSPSFGDAHLIFTPRNWKFDAFVQYSGQLDFDELAPEQQQRPYLYALDNNGNPFAKRWCTFNLRTQYAITKDLSTVVTFENITDQRYRTYSSGISAAGRNLILALQYVF